MHTTGHINLIYLLNNAVGVFGHKADALPDHNAENVTCLLISLYILQWKTFTYIFLKSDFFL